MGLTLDVEQSLEAAGLVDFYQHESKTWNAAAKKAYEYVKVNFPAQSVIRPDDVAKALIPVIEVRDDLRSKLDELKLRQKYWIARFADLIIDRAWGELVAEKKK